MTDFFNALTLLGNFLIIPGLTYGSQLALGALGVTLVYGVLRFSNFGHGETMAFGAMVTILVTWGLQSVDSLSNHLTALLDSCGNLAPSSHLVIDRLSIDIIESERPIQ